MSRLSFRSFFTRACGNGREPYPYQERFAEAEQLPEIVGAPTGAGKTATAALGWLWRLFYSGRPTPRRLLYCLPMRVLVEQSKREIEQWIKRATLEQDVSVNVLMGGVDADEWYLHPEKPAIIIGTQDMLLSRALNRGYAASRFHWPIDFGLLNNDCLWIFDEIQLMGTGLATSTQLQAFRETFKTFGSAKSVWMSATLLPRWLASVDYRDRIEPSVRLASLSLNPNADYEADGLRERWIAKKPIKQAMVARPSSARARKDSPGSTEIELVADDTKALATFVKDRHNEGSLTLVIVNQVDRSRALFEAINKLYTPGRATGRGQPRNVNERPGAPDLKLVHSQFRPKERETWWKWLVQDAESLQKENPLGRIVVSTQVVEAGVDLSARTLITELAPWPSLVQRFGRCNRRGEFMADAPAQVYWVDVATPDDKKAAPYSKSELDAARLRIAALSDVGLKSLTDFADGLDQAEREELFPFDPPHVIRRKDFVDLFDTTPDLAGNDIDVSRYIRDGEDIDVLVFWRPDEPPKRELSAAEARTLAPERDELCPVKLSKDGGIKEFLESHKAYRWDSLASTWVRVDAADVYPGQVYWVARAEGGYDPRVGWNPDAKWSADLWLRDPAEEAEPETMDEQGYGTDLLSLYGWRSIAQHTDDVTEQLTAMLGKLHLDESAKKVLMLAARWHDWGKSHHIFQAAINDDEDGNGKRPVEWRGKRDIAKAAPREFWRRYERPHFRHELASALGVLTLLKSGQAPSAWAELAPDLQNLSLYLIAAHHGKVRLSIRSMPTERIPDSSDVLFARGVWQDDELPGVDLGDGVTAPSMKLDLSPMMLGRVAGQPSWAERMLGLRDYTDFGPVKLAYLEALLRAADMRASKLVDEKAKKSRGATT
jgi:CRISPR-associated endonuclease/helicase Cas3